MSRMKKGASFSPEEVLRWIFPEAWEYFLPDILSEIERMKMQGKIMVLQNGNFPNYSSKIETGMIISVII